MAFYESPRFPELIAMGAVGGPAWETEVVRTISGHESRLGKWAYPLHRFEIGAGINAPADHATLRAFFINCRGRLHGFRFKDWTDYSATHTDGKVTGLTSTTFQLVKRYTSGSQTTDRKIVKPIASGFELKNSGTTLTLTTDYTLDATTGIVTTTTSRTAANLTWSGEFDVPVRFDTDDMQARVLARTPSRGILQQWEGVPLVELRL
ncbi:MAG: hypothetical protein RJA36_3972 [Pseudomonadota bacterium]|jgi:uncharacterized protein (TIGR02217 family)